MIWFSFFPKYLSLSFLPLTKLTKLIINFNSLNHQCQAQCLMLGLVPQIFLERINEQITCVEWNIITTILCFRLLVMWPHICLLWNFITVLSYSKEMGREESKRLSCLCSSLDVQYWKSYHSLCFSLSSFVKWQTASTL